MIYAGFLNLKRCMCLLVRQNFGARSENAINKQINLELKACQDYLAMAFHFNRCNTALPGAYRFFKNASDEERSHAILLMEYMNKRGGTICLEVIPSPKASYESLLAALQEALEMERTVNEDYDQYTSTVSAALKPWGFNVVGIHTQPNPVDAVRSAEAVFVGGGNTFVLLKTLYDQKLVDVIREQVLENGMPYIGSSAGTNVATRSIHVTNDMPMALPPTFDGIKLIPFNINPHYLETDPETHHKGETRDERIAEFLSYHGLPVLGLREGTSVLVDGNTATLAGDKSAKLFRPGQDPFEIEPKGDLSFLLKL